MSSALGSASAVYGPRKARNRVLEYLAPSDSRPTPVDIQGNDLMHW